MKKDSRRNKYPIGLKVLQDLLQIILSSHTNQPFVIVTRIIEIAGGRELYSQSRTKAVRKLRHNNTHKHNLRNKVRLLNKESVDYAADNISNEVRLRRYLINI